MAKFPYDVNTTRRIIDVYKQFPGGLKTVDTDDALGSVFLRQSENVSLSEFNFLEKRYGIIEKESIKQTNDTLQGYWEYMGFAIYAIKNRFYYRNSAGTESPVTTIHEENADYRYPATRPAYDSNTGFGSSGPFRDMNAVNINNVLYIFTGHYPVYVKIVASVPKFFWFSVTTPTYDEIVVTGHNLLEDDYDNAYGFTGTSAFNNLSNQVVNGLANPKIIQTDFYPKIPFAINEGTKGSVNFEFKGQFPGYDVFSTSGSNPFYEIKLDSIRYRTSLPGATVSAFTNVNLNSATFTPMNNYSSGSAINFIQNTVAEAYFLQGQTGIIEDNSTNLHRYDMTKTFTVEKNDLLKNESYALRVFKKESSGFSAFNLSQYATGALGENLFSVFITPIDTEDNELTSYKERMTVTQTTNTFKFTIPQGLYRKNNVSSYKVVFEHTVIENHSSATGPTDIDTDFASYFIDFVVFGQKTTAASGRLLTSSNVPSLDVSLTDLIAGTYDFEVTFAIEQYTYSSANTLLSIGGIELVSAIIPNISITAEKLQDFPGQTTDFLPKLKPIWSCNKVIEHYGKLMVWGSEDDTNGMPTAVFYSFPDRPTYFPSKFYLDFTNDTNEKIEAVTPYMNVLVAQTASRTFGIRGNSGLIDSPAPYVPFGINPTVGTIAYKSVRPVRNQLFFLSKQGIVALTSLYAVDETYNVKFVDRSIKNIVPQDSKAIGIQFDNQYWLNFPEKRITLRWYIDKSAWVQDKYQGWADEGFEGVFKYQIRDGKLEFITHPSTKAGVGQNKTIYKIGVDDTIPTDLFQPIKAIFETSFLNQNYPFHHKNYKEAKLDFTLQNEYNLGRNALFDSNVSEAADGGAMSTDVSNNVTTITVTLDSPTVFLKNHRYRVVLSIGAQGDDAVASLGVSLGAANPVENITQRTKVVDGVTVAIPEFEFVVNNTLLDSDASTIDLILPVGQTFNENSDDVSIRDVTYDDSLAFSTYVISEDKTLNFDNSPGYNQATVDVAVDLTEKGRLGDWSFGQSEFGDKVTAVKTIKLSGKGYNAKIYIEDLSKSKWTLESLGLTYKMRRARSR